MPPGPELSDTLRDSLLALAPVGLFLTDARGDCRLVNRRWCELTGLSAEEARGRGWARALHPEDAERVFREWREAAEAGREFLSEYRFRTPGGVVTWVEGRSAVLRDGAGAVEGHIGTVTDITARRRARAEAGAAGRWAAFLAGASHELASSLDYETTLRSVARLAVPAVADWCVVDLLEEDGSIRMVAAAHADPAREPWLAELQRYSSDPKLPQRARSLGAGEPVLLAEFTDEQRRVSARDARHLEVLDALDPRSILIAPLPARGRVLGTLLFASTIPGRYGLIDLALAEDLAGRCALAIDNARLYGEAREAARLRDEFLTIAAHELRTPLTTLHAHAQLVLRRAEREGAIDPQRSLGAMRSITHQADRLARLISQFLDISRIEAGKLTLDRREAEVAGLVAEVAAAAQARTEEHRIMVSAPGSLLASTDPLRLEQVIVNLLDNAIKYSPEGGPIEVDVGVGCWVLGVGEAEFPTANSRQPTAAVEIAVRDHGIGISPDQREHIFDRFYRAHAASRYSGIGVGLYISRQIVELHGGELTAEFPEDGGSRFVVRLPLKDPGS